MHFDGAPWRTHIATHYMHRRFRLSGVDSQKQVSRDRIVAVRFIEDISWNRALGIRIAIDALHSEAPVQPRDKESSFPSLLRFFTTAHSHNSALCSNGVSSSTIKTGFEIACNRVGITYGLTRVGGLTWHGLRHTFATRLREQGVHPFDIKELMGHKTFQSRRTMRTARQKQCGERSIDWKGLPREW